MGLILDKWENNKYHAGDGIYFPNDTVIPILTNKQGEYYLGTREDINTILEKDDDDEWADFYYNRNAIHNKYQLKFGGGNYESEGIIILEHSNVLEWIIHLNDCEEITLAKFDGNQIIAVAEYYPHINTFYIPINKPEDFIYTTKHEL
jgi:hypothetical protein